MKNFWKYSILGFPVVLAILITTAVFYIQTLRYGDWKENLIGAVLHMSTAGVLFFHLKKTDASRSIEHHILSGFLAWTVFFTIGFLARGIYLVANSS